jgi:ribosomal protein S20
MDVELNRDIAVKYGIRAVPTIKVFDNGDVVDSKSCIFEHLIRKPEDTPSVESLIETQFGKEDKDIRLLSYKILLEKFNDKYKKLNPNQKQLLKLYITNSPNNQNELFEFVISSVKTIKTDLDKNIKKCDNQVVQIKLSEVNNLLTTITESRIIKDNHVLSLLRYFELVKELKKIN